MVMMSFAAPAAMAEEVQEDQRAGSSTSSSDFQPSAIIDSPAAAWGRNLEGQLGNGTTTNSTTPIGVSNLSGDVKEIDGGVYYSLALKSDGTVWAWGYNDHGQLGSGTNTSSTTPVQVSNLSGVTNIAGGGLHSLAVKSDGTVSAWGNNYAGQLGNGTTTDSTTPVQVSNLRGVTDIAGGVSHSLVIKKYTVKKKRNGRTIRRTITVPMSWGNNYSGQLGNGTTTNSTTPVQVSSLSGVKDIASGGSHSLALKTDGTVRAWGYNYAGQLGNGTTTDSTAPVQVSNLSGITGIAGAGDHSLAK